LVVSSRKSGERLRWCRQAQAGGRSLKFGEDSFEILERILEAFFILDEEWRFIYLNSEAERVLLRSREELLGKNLWEKFICGR
jgi:PAS domain-containing protein